MSGKRSYSSVLIVVAFFVALTCSSIAQVDQQPYPPNGAGNVGVDTDLGWVPVTDNADSYDVYLGTDYNSVLNATCDLGDFDKNGQVSIGDLATLADCWLSSPQDDGCDFDYDNSGTIDLGELSIIADNWLGFGFPEFMGNFSESTYDAGTMVANQIYYWRVDDVQSETVVNTGQVFSFTTGTIVKDGIFEFVSNIDDVDLDGDIVYAINCGSTDDVTVDAVDFRGDVYQWQPSDINGDSTTDWHDNLYNANCPGKPTSPSPIAGVTVECSDSETNGMDHGPYEGAHSYDVLGIFGMDNMANVLSTSGVQNLGNPGDRDMIYRLYVTPGKEYKLQLFFFKNGTGSTAMDILVEGELAIEGLDTSSEIANGAGTVLVYSSILTATDSQIDIVIQGNLSFSDTKYGDINAITLEDLNGQSSSFDYVDDIADIDLSGNFVYAINCGSTDDFSAGAASFKGDVYQWQPSDINGDSTTDWHDNLYNANCPGKPVSPSPIAGVTVECSDSETNGMDHGPYEGKHDFDVSGISALGDLANVLKTSGTQNLGDNPGDRDMIYRLDVTPGKEYKLQLFFFKNSDESTDMDVLVEGNIVIDGLDIPVDITNAGHDKTSTAIVYTSTFIAADSQVDIVIQRNGASNKLGDINAITLEDFTPVAPVTTVRYVKNGGDLGLDGNMVYAINCGSTDNYYVGSVEFKGDVYQWKEQSGDTNGDSTTNWWDTRYNAYSPGKPTSPNAIAGVVVECSDFDTNGMDHGPYEARRDHNVSGISDMDNMADVLKTSGTQNLGNPGDRDMIYHLNVTAGKTYDLQLFFFENDAAHTGMDILVEDTLIIDGLDIYANIEAAGHNRADTVLVYRTTLTATDSWIDIVIKRNSAYFEIGEINAITLAEPTSVTTSTGFKVAGASDGVRVYNSDGNMLMRFRGFLTSIGMTQDDNATTSLINYQGNPTVQMDYNTDNSNVSITGYFTPIGDAVHVHYDIVKNGGDDPDTYGNCSILFATDPSPDRNNQSLWVHTGQADQAPYEVIDSHGFRFGYSSGYALLNLPGANLNWYGGGSGDRFSNLPINYVSGDLWATDADFAFVSDNNIRPTAGPAIAKGRSLALDIWTTQNYNMWDNSDNPLPVNTQVYNPLTTTQTVTLNWWAHDYNGNVVGSDSAVQDVAAGAVWDKSITFPAPTHGMLFVEVEAIAGSYSVFRRTNLTVLPPYTYLGDRNDSIFGINGTFGLPDAGSERALLQKIGVRWLRHSQHSLEDAESVDLGQRRHTEVNYWDGQSDNWFIDELRQAEDKNCPYWELNNEMNFGAYRDAAQYVNNALIPATARQQAIGSGVGIMIGGLGGWDENYINGIYDAGGWDYFDALNIHPGRGNYTPDYTDAFWSFLGIIHNYKNVLNNYGSKPLFVTEAYACTKPNSYWYDSYRDAADNVVLSYVLAVEEGIEVMDWYQLNDTIGSDVGGVDHEDPEYHYGLLNRDLSCKPSLLAYATIARSLDEATYVGRFVFDPTTENNGIMFNSPSNGNIAVLWNRKDGYVLTDEGSFTAHPEPWIDQWSTKVNVSLPAAGSTVTVIDSIGQPTIVQVTDGYVNLVLDGAPLIVYGLADFGVGGSGLTGEYYEGINFDSHVLDRIDATIDFSWGTGQPDSSITADTFSVRWTGQVKAEHSETYTFYTTTDDGVRLWVNGQQLIDKWVTQGGTEWSGTITLTAGQKYNIKMEYFEDAGGAEAKLRWESSSQVKEIIPQRYLFPTVD